MTKKFIFFIIFIFYPTILLAENNRYFSFDKGIVTLMYHRFNEPKYPSTNIQMDIFKEQIKIIENSNTIFIDPNNLDKEISAIHKTKSILLTIDDGFSSFYENAWPYLKNKKIPFILFISTREVGKNDYMTWDQIREVQKSKIGIIGNHSHTHDYLVDMDKEKINYDIDQSIKILKKELGYNPNYFSYPFGEYSLDFINIIKQNFNFAFGQHSGVIDLSKDNFQLPRFPINEKYGDLERFKSVINLLPFYYKNIFPKENYLTDINNPPEVFIEFFSEQNNLENITCYSNENNKWRKSKTIFENDYKLKILINEKFTTERGRINCSLNDKEGWRWFGIQFVIKKI
jgi:peptidoglycan/xylan/chitin deacetylase (PgdA/CDA1 family)